MSKLTFLLVFSLIYVVGLLFIYFSKKRLENRENTIYKWLIISNLIGILLQLDCDFVSEYYHELPIIVSIPILKLFIVYFVVWINTMLDYLLAIIYTDKKIIVKCNIALTVIESILVLMLPFQLHLDNINNIYYSYGPAIDFAFALSGILMIVMFVLVVLNVRKLEKNKVIPIGLFIIFGVVAAFIQKHNPSFVIIAPVETFLCLIMYFTMENPDMKMLDEVYRAKEISDNVNEEKELFIYNLTQDIRSISSAIDNDVDNILNSNNLNETYEYARQIKKDTTKFSTMTNEIFDISEIDSSNIKTYDNKYNIKLLFKELIKTYKIESENKSIKFISSIESDIPEYLYGDNINLRKVLTILLDNAIKNTNEGSIELNVSIIKKKDICRLIITIEDTGVGMSPQELNNILTKKEESDEEKLNVNDTVYNAKKIITLMGGTLIPSSVINVGTKIKIVLDQKIVRLDKDIDKYSKIYDKKKIAIVDNNESSIKIFKKLLDDENVIVEIFNYGQELLDKVRKNDKYDIVLLAEKIEPLNAFEIINKLKEVNNFNSKVILVTRNNNYEYDEEYKEYGFNDCLIKPIDKDKLIKIINE